MLKKTIKYTDFNGTERNEDFYFNFNTPELMQMAAEGGIVETIEKSISERNVSALSSAMETIILKAYGEKSEDGRRFIKSDVLSQEFSETEAYAQLFLELMDFNTTAAVDFITAIIPKEIVKNLPSADTSNLAALTTNNEN